MQLGLGFRPRTAGPELRSTHGRLELLPAPGPGPLPAGVDSALRPTSAVPRARRASREVGPAGRRTASARPAGLCPTGLCPTGLCPAGLRPVALHRVAVRPAAARWAVGRDAVSRVAHRALRSEEPGHREPWGRRDEPGHRSVEAPPRVAETRSVQPTTGRASPPRAGPTRTGRRRRPGSRCAESPHPSRGARGRDPRPRPRPPDVLSAATAGIGPCPLPALSPSTSARTGLIPPVSYVPTRWARGTRYLGDRTHRVRRPEATIRHAGVRPCGSGRSADGGEARSGGRGRSGPSRWPPAPG